MCCSGWNDDLRFYYYFFFYLVRFLPCLIFPYVFSYFFPCLHLPLVSSSLIFIIFIFFIIIFLYQSSDYSMIMYSQGIPSSCISSFWTSIIHKICYVFEHNRKPLVKGKLNFNTSIIVCKNLRYDLALI